MQICTYSEYTFSGFKNSFNAFKNMGLGGNIFGAPLGLETVKPMGTGSGNGFSIFPDFNRFAFFAVWENRNAAECFFAESELIHTYEERAVRYLHTILLPVKVHGKWGGKEPLRPQPVSESGGAVAVLTRATIKTRHLPEFWMNVPDVSAFMADAPGVLHNLGVGEYPLFMQATFSLWKDAKALSAAAYGNTAHADVVRKTRERGWYAEEMFSRFEVVDIKTKGREFEGLAKEVMS
ncbi:MAG: hypothetical protein ABR572_03580 [Cryomorphaceae bacterium]